MNKTRSIINIIFILISNVYLSAVNVNVNFLSYEVENGLSSNRTSCCTQDSYGYIWIGTRDGLNKFDGYTFEIFRSQENDTTSLLSNWITTISLNSDSILHIGTNKGIQKFDYSNKRLTMIVPSILNESKELNCTTKLLKYLNPAQKFNITYLAARLILSYLTY